MIIFHLMSWDLLQEKTDEDTKYLRGCSLLPESIEGDGCEKVKMAFINDGVDRFACHCAEDGCNDNIQFKDIKE